MLFSPRSALVLAAGKGTRMRSQKAKVLHEIFFAPMIRHVLEALKPLSFDETLVVIGHQQEKVREALAGDRVSFVEQKEQLGTAHAVLSASPWLAETGGTVMILCGDTPLLRSETLHEMLQSHADRQGALSVMTTLLENPTHYGRVVTDDQGRLLRIVEEKDATPGERRINEVNAGIYCAEVDFLLHALREITTDNAQGEYYLTDIVQIAVQEGREVGRFVCEDPEEVLGVNSRLELALAHGRLQQRRNRELMLSGVTFLQPGSICVANEVIIGQDTVLHPGVQLLGRTTLGKGCIVEAGAILHDCTVGDGVRVGAYSYLKGVALGSGQDAAPHTIQLG